MITSWRRVADIVSLNVDLGASPTSRNPSMSPYCVQDHDSGSDTCSGRVAPLAKSKDSSIDLFVLCQVLGTKNVKMSIGEPHLGSVCRLRLILGSDVTPSRMHQAVLKHVKHERGVALEYNAYNVAETALQGLSVLTRWPKVKDAGMEIQLVRQWMNSCRIRPSSYRILDLLLLARPPAKPSQPRSVLVYFRR